MVLARVAAPKTSRRKWIAGGAALAAAAAVPVGGWLLREPPSRNTARYGALRPDPRGVLDLLEGFSYRVLERAGGPMSDGSRVPVRPDGMACFDGGDGTLVLMRNHEIPLGFTNTRPPPGDPYDRRAHGGVTRLVLDAETLTRRGSNHVLTGTSMNCSGGPSPWGWLSCEEDPRDSAHGFVFLCDPSASEGQAPARVDGYGRFKHEAAAIDPERLCAYLTEDQGDGCLYRFTPDDLADPMGPGQLAALRVAGVEDSGGLRRGETVEYSWVPLRDATPSDDDLRHRAAAAGATKLRRGEGVTMGDGSVWVAATAGGPIAAGQIFRLEDEPEGGALEVIACSEDRGALDMPDNLAFSPHGSLFFVEDGGGHDYLRGVSADHALFDVARNAASDGELAGPCFTPDGRALFVNLQIEGLTLVIEGPFETLGS